MPLTEQFILLQAPNPAAAENGRKLSKKGSFSAHHKTKDDSLYWAECAGSALFGLMFYDGRDKTLCLHPYSVVTPDEILRLQY